MKQLRLYLSNIPNTITALNLLLGCISITYSFNGDLITASILIFIAGFFDYLDGLAARVLKAYSELGKSLDSLADMVSFGVAPSVILYQMIIMAMQKINPSYSFETASLLESIIIYTPFIIAVFSALRLAKFNIDERQTKSFIGVPTPANAFLIASFPFIIANYQLGSYLLLNIYILVPLIFILSFLLTSNIPMLSLKMSNIKFADNKAVFIIIALSVVLLIVLKMAAIPVIYCAYLIVSVIDNSLKVKR